MYAQLTEAAEHVAETLKDPIADRDKWSHYQGLTKESQLEWRKREGHAEFCRLQRLAYHAFL